MAVGLITLSRIECGVTPIARLLCCQLHLLTISAEPHELMLAYNTVWLPSYGLTISAEPHELMLAYITVWLPSYGSMYVCFLHLFALKVRVYCLNVFV